MAEPRRLKALIACAAVAVVMSDCGEKATEVGTPDSDETSPPGVDATAEPRAEGKAKDNVDKQARREKYEARCAELRRSVAVSYQVMTRPIATGKEIWLRLTVRNGTDHYVGGPFGGILRVTAAQSGQPLPMNWGGSSSDEAGAEAHTTFVHQVLNLNGQPLRTPAEARVTDVALDYTNLELCPMSVRMRAPQGLVTEHPSGRWYVTPEGEEISRPGG